MLNNSKFNIQNLTLSMDGIKTMYEWYLKDKEYVS